MPRAPGYITKHHGYGWKYQFHIPVRLRPLFPNKAGKPSAAFVRYIKPMTHADAMKIAREMAVEHGRKIEAWREATDEQIAKVAVLGGLPTFEPGSAASEDYSIAWTHEYVKPLTLAQERYKDALMNAVQPAKHREEACLCR